MNTSLATVWASLLNSPESLTWFGSVAVWLVDALAKTSLLLALTGCAAWLMRRRSAACLHRLWTLGFCGCLLIPAVSWLAPLGTVPVHKYLPQILPELRLASEAEGTATLSATTRRGTTSPDSHGLPNLPAGDHLGSRPQEANRVRSAENETSGSGPNTIAGAFPAVLQQNALVTEGAANDQTLASQILASQPLAAETTTSPVLSRWPVVLVGVWLLGVLACGLRMLWLQQALRRVLRTCTEINSPLWLSAAAQASRQLGFTRPVKLLQSDRLPTPALAGLGQAVVILPADADSWTAARRELVLLHELGHALRRDVLTHTAAQLVCVLYWMNPLCWLGLNQMGKLRELACDDLVLTSGQLPADYADALLDVARSYRLQNLGMGVGMARQSNLETRILSILDRTRDRVHLTPGAARRWLLTTGILVVLLGSLQLTTQAEPVASETPTTAEASESTPAQTPATVAKDQTAETKATEATTLTGAAAGESPSSPPSSPPSSSAADTAAVTTVTAAEQAEPETRTMKVLVTDENGQPLEGAKVYQSVWPVDNDPNFIRFKIANTTDAQGIAQVQMPKQVRILRLWASRSDYVPEFMNFAEGTHANGSLLPETFAFQLTPGSQLSGTVVDSAGKPIEGAKVEVSVIVPEQGWQQSEPIVSTWLASETLSNAAPVTDAEGRWAINNAPADGPNKEQSFRITVSHPNHVREALTSGDPAQPTATTSKLRDGTAKIRLSQGAQLRGTVVDSAGKPVSSGIVIWSNSPYYGNSPYYSDDYETAIQQNGTFTSPSLSPGEYPITVVVPGHQPLKFNIDLSATSEALQVTLPKDKHTVTIQVVDPTGQPIPNAFVSIDNWRDSQSLYNHRHPNVLDSGIPYKANDQGLYTWDWAPADTVTYIVGAEGYIHRSASLQPQETPHVVELVPVTQVSGSVIDAGTQEPVQQFRVIPVKVFDNGWHEDSDFYAIVGVDGKFEIAFSDLEELVSGFRLRIEAPGYRTLFSEQFFKVGTGKVAANFELEPAPARQGRVLSPEGKPIEGAKVLFPPDSSLSNILTNNQVPENSGYTTETTAAGEFSLPSTTEALQVRVLHPSGIAHVDLQPNAEIGNVQLQPWAKISGQLLHAGKPVANRDVIFQSVVMHRDYSKPFPQFVYLTATDLEGRYTFPQVPPGEGIVVYSSSNGTLLIEEGEPVLFKIKLAPGEHQQISDADILQR